MFRIWRRCCKLIPCLVNFFDSSQIFGQFYSKTASSRFFAFGRLQRKLFVLPFLCGVPGKDEKTTDSDAAEQVVHNVALATIALKDGNVEKSEKMLMTTLDLAETKNFSLGIISCCDILSSMAIKHGDFEKAENLLIRALNRLTNQGVSENDNFVVSFRLKLSRMYSSCGSDELAELGFRNCLDLQKEKMEGCSDEETVLLSTAILYWYGKFLQRQNRFREAKSRFRDCYLTSLKIDGLLPNQIMVILYNLGEVCQILGENDEALNHFLKGVSLDRKRKNPDLTYFYTKIGTVSLCKGLYKEAKLWCDEGLKFATRYQNVKAERESNDCLEKIDKFLTLNS